MPAVEPKLTHGRRKVQPQWGPILVTFGRRKPILHKILRCQLGKPMRYRKLDCVPLGARFSEEQRARAPTAPAGMSEIRRPLEID